MPLAQAGWERELPKVRSLVVQCRAAQRPFMIFDVVRQIQPVDATH